MRRLLVLLLVLSPAVVSAQIRYYAPAGSGVTPASCTGDDKVSGINSSGVIICTEDVAGAFSTPGAGFIADVDGAGTLAGRTNTTGGTLVIQNAAGAAANPVFDVDESLFARAAEGTADKPATCGDTGDTYQIRDVYTETDSGEVCTCTAIDTWQCNSGTNTGDNAGYATVDDEDGALTVRTVLNFEGDGVTCADDTNQTTCTIPGGGATFDPSTTITIYEEFINGLVTAGNIGENGLNFTAIATGTIAQGATTATNPGTIRVNSHATNDNSGAAIHMTGNGGSASAWSTVWANGTWTLDAVIILGANSTAITNTSFAFGLSQSTSTPFQGSSGSVYIRRDTDLTDAAFIGALCDSATNGCGAAAADTNQEIVTSTITPSGGNAYRFRISQDFTGPGSTRKISMRVNNETALTFCSSGCTTTVAQFPSGVTMSPVFTYLTRTTTGVLSAEIDYMYVTVTLGAARY